MKDEQAEQDRLDEQECGKRVEYWLEKYGCTLHGQAILENGSVIVRVGVTKIPRELQKQIKDAKKGKQVATDTPAQN